MLMHAFSTDTHDLAQPLEPSWLSGVGFDLAQVYQGQGWIVLIDPEQLPSVHQCQFYGIKPEHILVVRSSATRSVDHIIAEFHRCQTAAAIVTWTTPQQQRLSHIPLYDLEQGVKHQHLQSFMGMPAATLNVH